MRVVGLAVAALLLAACSAVDETMPDGRAVAVLGADVSSDGHTLNLHLDVCNGRLAYSVDDTGEDVRIGVRAPEELADADCTDVLTVTLQGPLMSRRVVDISTGQAVDVQAQ